MNVCVYYTSNLSDAPILPECYSGWELEFVALFEGCEMREDICEQVFALFNPYDFEVPEWCEGSVSLGRYDLDTLRSMSVGDIVVIGDKFTAMCTDTGWVGVNVPLNVR